MCRWPTFETATITDWAARVTLVSATDGNHGRALAWGCKRFGASCRLYLPFSEWTEVIPNARLCKAVLDRITDRAHIIDTGHESYRFRRTLEKRQKKG